MEMTPGALEGIRILDFTQMMAGPFGTQMLGDLGADIIKVERPKTGEWERGLNTMGKRIKGDSPFFLAMNRNKRSLTLNLKNAKAVQIAHELAKSGDVVVHNFRPEVMERLGLGYKDFKAVKPDIIYCSSTGFGESGPYVTRPGQDLLIQGMTGIAANTGRAGDPPTPVANPLCDAQTALMVAFSICAALVHRERTGEGQKVEVSLFNTAISVQCQELVAFMNMQERWERSRSGIKEPWMGAPYGIYETADGYLSLAMNPLTKLGELIDLPKIGEYDDPLTAYDKRDEVKDLIQARLKEKTTEEWLDILLEGDIWCGPVQGFEELVNDPQARHNEMIQEVDHPQAGRLKLVGSPVKLSKTPASIRMAPPLVGQHNREVLRELGFSDEDIDGLESDGAI